MRVLPLTDADARRLVDASPLAPLLSLMAESEAPHLEALLLRLAWIVEQLPELADIELNPVLAAGDAVSITAARVRIAASTWTPSPTSDASAEPDPTQPARSGLGDLRGAQRPVGRVDPQHRLGVVALGGVVGLGPAVGMVDAWPAGGRPGRSPRAWRPARGRARPGRAATSDEEAGRPGVAISCSPGRPMTVSAFQWEPPAPSARSPRIRAWSRRRLSRRRSAQAE